MAKLNPLDALLESLVDRIADRISSRFGSAAPSGKSAGGKRASARKGKTLDMTCRVPGCKNRSRGPRFGFICDEHGKKLSKTQQAAAREAWKAKHG